MRASSAPDGRAPAFDADEAARFGEFAESWWDPDGPLGPLHAMNPARLAFIRAHAVRRFGADPRARRPLEGRRALDIGCGAGIVAEPLARMGAEVTAIDVADGPLEAGRRRAREGGLAIDYRNAVAADVSAGAFDLVTALEVVEHVPDRDAFLADAARAVAPGGLLALSTINRTPAAFAVAIVGAEYLLRVLPRGTHRFSRFVRPSEIARALVRAGLAVEEIRGLARGPLSGTWRLSGNPAVNYLLAATRPAPTRP